ncbi:unnamed protein product [Periconia digitata]|uniref:Uncharacterized protein n=1 Tax=Periconia digitata TaxID=1303443 RepID=A0A9W4UIP5_9PLEO|nr:unnamed protein product [Periconia digitata]
MKSPQKEASMWTTILLPIFILSATTTAFNFTVYGTDDCTYKPNANQVKIGYPDAHLEYGCYGFTARPEFKKMQLQWTGDKDNKYMLATFKTEDCCWADLVETFGWEDECVEFKGNEMYSFRVFDPENLDKGLQVQEDLYKCKRCKGDRCLDKGLNPMPEPRPVQ